MSRVYRVNPALEGGEDCPFIRNFPGVVVDDHADLLISSSAEDNLHAGGGLLCTKAMLG